LGGATVAMAMVAIGAASAFVVDPRSPVVVVAFLALIVLHLVLGWKVRRLAGAPASVRAIAPAGPVDLTVAGSARP
jgi:hypothetical protein